MEGAHDGSFVLGTVKGWLDVRHGSRDGSAFAEFSWGGFSDADPACGRGWAALRTAGRLVGHIFITTATTPASSASPRDFFNGPARPVGLTRAPKLIVRHGTDVLATTAYPAGIRKDRMAVPQRRFITLWWLYLAGLVALFGITLFNYVLEGFFSTFLGMVVTWAFLNFDLLCMAGLYAYVKSLTLFTKTFWRTLVVLLALRISLVVPLFAVQLRPWDGTSEQYVAIFALVSLLYCIPMLWALWSYAFRSPQFWAAVPLR